MVHITLKKKSKRFPGLFMERRIASFEYASSAFAREFDRLAKKGKTIYAWGETDLGPEMIAWGPVY